MVILKDAEYTDIVDGVTWAWRYIVHGCWFWLITWKLMDDVDVEGVSLEPEGTQCIDVGSGLSHGNSWMMWMWRVSLLSLKVHSALMLVLAYHMETHGWCGCGGCLSWAWRYIVHWCWFWLITWKLMDDVDVEGVSLEPEGSECIDVGSGLSQGNSRRMWIWMVSLLDLKYKVHWCSFWLITGKFMDDVDGVSWA